MKKLSVLLLLFFAITISCKEKKSEVQPVQKKVTATVKHYICDNKCEGSGGETAGNCPTCKTPYTHNLAFHNNDFLKNGPLKVPKTDLGTPPPANNNTASPAQNALGVYHYTCTNGCSGGAGSAAKCKSCGTDLAHNQAYHN